MKQVRLAGAIGARMEALVVMSALVMLLTGCSGSSGPPQPTGPLVCLNVGEVTVGMKTPRNGQHPSLGTLLVTNTDPSREVTLAKIRLGGVQHLGVEAAYVVPIINGSKFGGGFLVPPSAEGFPDATMDEQWAARQPLAGYRVPPGQDANLLVVVNTDDPEGGMSEWLELDYSVGGRQYLAVANTNLCVNRAADTAACVT